VQKYGTGGLNIDGCRVESGSDYHELQVTQGGAKINGNGFSNADYNGRKDRNTTFKPSTGRFPANLILDEQAGALLDEQAPLVGGAWAKSIGSPRKKGSSFDTGMANLELRNKYVEEPSGASRFFYCAKASKSERNAGLEGMPYKEWKDQGFRDNETTHLSPRAGAGRTSATQNHHPTVKPIKLMRYLCKLITPPNGTVLDPFMGSGSTGIAAKEEGFGFIGIELDPDYYEIANRRIGVDEPRQLTL